MTRSPAAMAPNMAAGNSGTFGSSRAIVSFGCRLQPVFEIRALAKRVDIACN